jgi:thiosulfate reductase cytochrome b subunit
VIPAAIVVVAGGVFLARWLRDMPGVVDFLAQYPGESPLPDTASVGIPAWLGWQHFLNAFFIVLIIKSGWTVRTTQRPPAYWTRNNSGFIRTKRAPKRVSLDLWLHQTLDVLWVLNGVVFIVLLFATGHWMRIVPTSWDVVPNALSAALQYASLDWPLDNGWVNYNGLQLLAYFVTVFIAAPLAIITGLRMSAVWPATANRINRIYPIEAARAIHFPVMLYFVLFIITHVALVFATGALRNLNHMYAARDEVSWLGLWIFVASLVAIVVAWIAARPLLLRPIASLMGKVSR